MRDGVLATRQKVHIDERKKTHKGFQNYRIMREIRASDLIYLI